ncbi:Nodule Cysteine-Rich (NCR) secreted peptide [Medicago truncatula]|uniref:Nodule Cysteine-Rich (NCR) secreted peptide n=1 Tax=Medicago truncatula TaxID=3880 RepID=A0A072V8J4_MEDTR|nr:Nodule Cysteine-Rich (NCR) secreted peptide [Medicago truncatula]
MTRIVKFIFISIFLVAMSNPNFNPGDPFLDVLNFLNYFIHNIFSHLNNTLSFSFFITTGRKCKQNSDCSKEICVFPWKPTCVEPYFLMILIKRYNYCTCT